MKLPPEQLSAHLARELAPIYVIHGDEPLLIQEAAAAIRVAFARQGDYERQCLTVESGFDWNSLRLAFASPSLFATCRLLELRLGTARPGDAGGKVLTAYAGRPVQDTVLLMSCGKLDATAQKSQWFTALERAGVTVRVWPIAARQLPAWIEQRLRTHGLQPTAEAVALLAERVEGNLLAAAQEIEKLQVLLGSGTVTAEQLLEVVGDSARYSVYDLVDSALEGNATRTVRILNGLRSEGVEAVLVSWALQREIRLLSGLAFAVERGLMLDAALAQGQVWEKRKPLLRRALQRQSTRTCRGLLRGCARLDRLVKGVEQGNVWDELLDLSLRLAGRKVLAGVDDG